MNVPVRLARLSKVSGLKSNPQPSLTVMTNEKMGAGCVGAYKDSIEECPEETHSFPAGERLRPHRKWCYMLVKQLRHHTVFLVSFVMPSNRKRKVPSPYLWNQRNEGETLVPIKDTSPHCCPLEVAPLNRTTSVQPCNLCCFTHKIFPAAKSHPKSTLPWKHGTLMCPGGESVKPHTKNSCQKNSCLTYGDIWTVTLRHFSEMDTTAPQAVNTFIECNASWNFSQSHKTDRVGFHQYGGLQSKLLLLLDVVSHVAELLLHHAHRLEICRVVEGVTSQ